MKKYNLMLLLVINGSYPLLAQQGMGIGNNNPQEMLDVSGAIKLGTTTNSNAGTIRWNGTNFQGYDGAQWVNLDGAGGADADWTVSGVNQYSGVTGNVGIGTTSPTNKLHISTSGHTGANVNAGNGFNSYIDFAENGTNRANIFWNGAGDYLEVNSFTGNTIVNANGGNVGIGTTTPGAKLEVAGQIKITGGTPGANKVLSSDATGLASWVDPTTLVDNGAFTTTSGVTSNAPGNYASDDFVFGSPQLADDGDSQHDVRFFFDKSKGSFRAGAALSTEWDDVNVGLTSFAAGLNNTASGAYSFAMGQTNTVSGSASGVFGRSNVVESNIGIAIGRDNNLGPGADRSVALGTSNELLTSLSFAAGNGNVVSGDQGMALGSGTLSRSFGETSLGMANTDYTPVSTIGFHLTDRLLVVGNGSSSVTRSDALVILKNGNTGIGISAPTAKLEVAGQLKVTGGTPGANKVLTSDATGLASWVDPNTLVSDDGDWTISGVNQYSAVSGNVGIGATTPESKLNVSVSNNGLNTPLVLRNLNTTQGGNAVGIGFANGDLNNAPQKVMIVNERTESFGRGKLHFILNDVATATAANLSDAKMTIDRSGNVGIGTTSPAAKLDVTGAAALNDNQLRLRGGTDGNHFLSYIGGSFDGAKLTGNNNVILNTITGGDALIVTGNRVGIGTASPIAPLHVESQANASYGNFTFYALNQYTNHPNSPGSCCGGTVNGISIHASGRVMASEFDAFSDARIKNVIQVSDSEEDLYKLLAIEITDYRMKDAAKDVKPYKKVIAQQVESVYPQAVSRITEVIPNIYEISTINNGFIPVDADLEIGDRVKLIFENESEMATVVSYNSEGFEVDIKKTGNVFVYGKEVHDFRTVDYEALSMLNVSATQELFTLIQNLQRDNIIMKASLKNLESLTAEVEKLKTWTNYLQQTEE